MLSAENWCLKVDEKVYGPYTTQQMRRFAHEGRLASWSLVSPAGGRSWREARNEGAFSSFFSDIESPLKPAQRAFGKRYDLDAEGAVDGQPSAQLLAAVKKPARKKSHADELGAGNFIVIFDVVNGAASRVEAAVITLGEAFRIADNVWHVRCELTATGVRNFIAPYLRRTESIFVVDASRGRTCWANYTPQIQAKICAAYMKGN